MKIKVINQLIMKEYKNYFYCTVLLLIVVDLIFKFFGGLYISPHTASIYWLGGDKTHSIPLSFLLLKLVNISILFLIVGRMMNKLKEDIMMYVLSRIRNYYGFMKRFTILLFVYGVILVIISHLLFYCVFGLSLDRVDLAFWYLLIDCLGFVGMLAFYIILENGFSIENSYLVVLVLYILNTIVPIPIIIASSTLHFMKYQQYPLQFVCLILCVDVIILLFYRRLLKKKEILLC